MLLMLTKTHVHRYGQMNIDILFNKTWKKVTCFLCSQIKKTPYVHLRYGLMNTDIYFLTFFNDIWEIFYMLYMFTNFFFFKFKDVDR